jgi:hypothetical protein
MRHTKPRSLLLALGAALVLLLVGCGGSNEAASASEPTIATIEEPTPTPREAGPAAFAALPAEVVACLEDLGITPTQRGTANDAGSAADQQTAIQECADDTGTELPERTAGVGRPDGVAPDQEALAECLVERGIEVEPDADAPRTGGLVGSLDLDDLEVAAALEACGFTPRRRGAAS